MDISGYKTGTGSQSSDSPASVGSGSTSGFEKNAFSPLPSPSLPAPTPKGVENAKKRLRAFSIMQKKTPLSTMPVPKAVNAGGPTVYIGKLSSVKVTAKPEDPAAEQKKPPKPPKPGYIRKLIQAEHMDQQKKTLSEIEDMKRKMELVELGIPLGLICPSSNNDKAMPTKAMPPIKSFIDPAKVDEIIQEAKKAKAEGKPFKFDYQKLLPGYDNPFQRKKDDPREKEKRPDDRSKTKDRRSDKFDKRSSKKHDKYREERPKSGDKKEIVKKEKGQKETDVNLNDYLVCDSWSLDNEDKIVSPKVDEKPKPKSSGSTPKPEDPVEQLKESIQKTSQQETPKTGTKKIGKLKPVIDSFEYEIDPNEEALDIFDEQIELEKFSKPTATRTDKSPIRLNLYDDEVTKDGANDESFLQSVINEIQDEEINEDSIQDKGLVEYEISPKDDESPRANRSVTPEVKDSSASQRSDFSDSFKSMESGYRSTESGYRSTESSRSYRMSLDKDFEEAENNMSKSTVDSLEVWSFVLKICQPLLFRHDKDKCYKETHAVPKVWFAENPKTCRCVKDRAVVYEELETCKMSLVDRVYGCDQISDFPCPSSREWYPPLRPPAASPPAPVPRAPRAPCDDWESEEQPAPHTPQRTETVYLDREYQRFMQAVLSDVSEQKADAPRSTTPVAADEKKKKPRLNSEGWSQESDVDDQPPKSKKMKFDKDKVKTRKRKHSTTSVTDSDDQAARRKKSLKKKENKKEKLKLLKRKKLGKKYLKKLKEKQKKRKKAKISDESEEDEENEREKKKKDKKRKKKKLQKKRKHRKKKRSKAASSSSSSTSSSDSSSDSDSDSDARKKKKKSQGKKKRKQSSSSARSDELFDVNILNNIKTERMTDDETFSPRKKPREIINVKELQSDFVGNNLHIKRELELPPPPLPAPHSAEDKAAGLQASGQEELENNTDVVAEKESPHEEVLEKVEDQKENLEEEIVEKIEEVVEKIEKEKVEKMEVEPVKEIEICSEEKTEEKAEEMKIDPPHHPSPPRDPRLANSKQATAKRPSNLGEKIKVHQSLSTDNTADRFANYDVRGERLPDDKFAGYDEGNYEMLEQMAMAYQSDVSKESAGLSQRIETVVGGRRGEIKCDWRRDQLTERAGHPDLSHRPSRWGLKPGDVNIVLTGGSTEPQPQPQVQPQPVYRIQSLAKRTSDSCSIGYDEAYQDMYGASDRLQYGDCFADTAPPAAPAAPPADTPAPLSSLDERISRALQGTVLGEVAKEVASAAGEGEGRERGILVTRPPAEPARAPKRVSFADGYEPGQDSDIEEPPVKKARSRAPPASRGCAWPCPAWHPDHVPLWDALPPPPPPPGDPPPLQHLLHKSAPPTARPPPFMPPEPPPGILSF